MPWLAGFITSTSEANFSVHTGFVIVHNIRSERLEPRSVWFRRDCRLPEGKSKRARLGGLSAFWGSSDEPLKPYRPYPPDLPSKSGRESRFPIHWGASTARERGPIIGTVSRPHDRNVIGSHGGSYAVYRALAVSAGALDPIRRPDLTNTHPAAKIGPFPQWADPRRIVSLDPWGHLVAETFASEIAEGLDVRPTIAITKAHARSSRDSGGAGGWTAAQ